VDTAGLGLRTGATHKQTGTMHLCPFPAAAAEAGCGIGAAHCEQRYFKLTRHNLQYDSGVFPLSGCMLMIENFEFGSRPSRSTSSGTYTNSHAQGLGAANAYRCLSSCICIIRTDQYPSYFARRCMISSISILVHEYLRRLVKALQLRPTTIHMVATPTHANVRDQEASNHPANEF